MEDEKVESHIYDVIVIGAGFCGIACGAGLKTYGISNFIILEKGDCVGYFWKHCTYDRLHHLKTLISRLLKKINIYRYLLDDC